MTTSKKQYSGHVLIISGSRSSTKRNGHDNRMKGVDNDTFETILDAMKRRPDFIIQGGASGVDYQAEVYAK